MRDHKNHRPPRPEEMPLTMLLNELSRLFHNEMRAESGKIGVKDGYRHVLIHLAREENLSQLELAERTHFKAPTISVTLAKMEQDGLVTKTADPTDGRTTRLSLTEKGRALDRALQDCIRQKDRAFAECLSPEETAQLKGMLLRIRSHLLENGWQEDGCAPSRRPPRWTETDAPHGRAE